MRNIRIADRSDWVTTLETRSKPASKRTLRPSRGLGIVIVMIAAVLTVPFLDFDGSDANAGVLVPPDQHGPFQCHGSRRARNLNGEFVVVKNTCDRTMSLKGWKLRDVYGHVYRFPSDQRLRGGKTVAVHTGQGPGDGRSPVLESLRDLSGTTSPLSAPIFDRRAEDGRLVAEDEDDPQLRRRREPQRRHDDHRWADLPGPSGRARRRVRREPVASVLQRGDPDPLSEPGIADTPLDGGLVGWSGSA